MPLDAVDVELEGAEIEDAEQLLGFVVAELVNLQPFHSGPIGRALRRLLTPPSTDNTA